MDWFFILFLAVACLVAMHQISLGIQAIRTGETVYYFRYHYRRADQPVMFWWVTIGRLAGPLLMVSMMLIGLRAVGVIRL